jgi:hypothetical protein
MLDRIKAWLKWLYNWITVISAAVIGGLVYLPPLLDVFSANMQPLLPPNKAVAIMACVGVVKGLCALVQSKLAA